jgi:lipopolysaccharide biosynthesis glycosyltransferase/glycosyltransferase involved in cell wall biosynthesis
MKYYITLVKGHPGSSYTIRNIQLLKGKRKEVPEDIYEYLSKKPNFKGEIEGGYSELLPGKQPTLIYPTSVDYDFMQQRPHHILRSLARLGLNTIFMDSRGKEPIRYIEPGFVVISGNKELKPTRPLIYYYTYPPHIHFIDKYKPDLVIFDSVDEPSGPFHHWANDYVPSLERADIVLASAKKLYEKALQYNKNSILVPNGVDYDKFSGAVEKTVPKILENRLDGRPVIGFYGSVAGWLDIPMLDSLIETTPEYQFLIVGPDNDGVHLSAKTENLIRLPYTPYDELPDILSVFDVGIVPFKPSDIALSCNPLKMWEYLAGGKPVVVTNIVEAEGLSGVYHATRDNIRETLAKAIAASSPYNIKLRQDLARSNSWDDRASLIIKALETKLNQNIKPRIGADNRETMNVVMVYGPNWSTYVAIEAFALFNTNRGPIKLYLISDKHGRVDMDPICKMFGPDYTYEFIEAEGIFNQIITSSSNIDYRYTKYTLYRLLIPKLVEEDTALYIDTDAIVNGDIRPVYETNLDGGLIAGVQDSGIEPFLNTLGLKPDDTYVNAGVLLMDLARIRGLNIDDAWLEMVNTKFYTFHDQDIINLSCKGKIVPVDHPYNVSLATGIDVPDKDIKVMHYAGAKPWVHPDPPHPDIWNKWSEIYRNSKLPMIPNRIHYCWFGGKDKPEIVQKCIESWKKYAGGYEIIEWNESNFNIGICKYVKEAYDQKKYAFVTDYVRMWALYNYGGIYMDGDVELLQPIDQFRVHRAFTGHETEDLLVTAIMGSEPEHPWIKKLLDYYIDAKFVATPNTNIITDISSPMIVEQKNGFTYLDNDVVIYPVEYFCPYDHKNLKAIPTKNSYAVHHFAGTWLGRTKV